MVKSRKGPEPFAKDEHNRPDTTAESLAKLKPAFRKDGTITAGQRAGPQYAARPRCSSPSARWAEKKGLEPHGRLVSWGVGAVEPGMFGFGPVPAVKQALDARRLEDRRRRAVRDQRGLRGHRARGDAATSDCRRTSSTSRATRSPTATRSVRLARIQTTRLLHSMQRDGIKRGIVTMCIGGGQGIALCLEAFK